jgi:hypothetical protein
VVASKQWASRVRCRKLSFVLYFGLVWFFVSKKGQVDNHMKTLLSPRYLLVISLAYFHQVQLHACSVCMGAKTGPLADASNGAIFLMLGVLAVVLSLISLAGFTIVRRGKVPVAPHVELISSLPDSNSF